MTEGGGMTCLEYHRACQTMGHHRISLLILSVTLRENKSLKFNEAIYVASNGNQVQIR